MTKYFSLLCISLMLAGCAGQRLPEGGPVDTTPPEIVSVSPAPSTVNFTGDRIVVEFSEYVERRSVEDAVFISPAVEGKEFEWSGRELEIIFPDSLRANTTYVLSIGTDAVDVNARVRMAKAFITAFSTGPRIDRGAVTGRVYDDAPDGVLIAAYKLSGIRPDTLNPAITKPDYLTQTGTNGAFTLTNLAAGPYRLFAVRDEFKNLLYDAESDAVGTTDDITVTETDTLISGLKFVIAKEDTTPPRISSVTVPDGRHLVVQFSEPVDSATVTGRSFSVTDTLGRSALTVERFFANGPSFTGVTLITSEQVRDSLYLLTATGVRDLSGNVIHPDARTKLFTGSGTKDTVMLTLLKSSLQETGEKVLPGSAIELQFNDAVRQPVPDTAFVLRRLKDSSIVPFTIGYPNLHIITLMPKRPFLIGEKYALLMKGHAVFDLLGNRLKDSITVFPMTGDDPENYGSIEGMFAGFGGKRNIVAARNLSAPKQPERQTLLPANGKFSFPLLPDGRYLLRAFDDRNGNGRLDAGTPFPWKRAEPFSLGQDTIRVRARWPVEGATIRVK